MKSNLEYLKEAIEKGTDTSEWLEAVEDELTEAKDKIKELEQITDQSDEVSRLEDEVEELNEAIEGNEGFTMIDFGYGKLYWKSDNLNIQSVMEGVNKRHGIGEMEEA